MFDFQSHSFWFDLFMMFVIYFVLESVCRRITGEIKADNYYLKQQINELKVNLENMENKFNSVQRGLEEINKYTFTIYQNHGGDKIFYHHD